MKLQRILQTGLLVAFLILSPSSIGVLGQVSLPGPETVFEVGLLQRAQATPAAVLDAFVTLDSPATAEDLAALRALRLGPVRVFDEAAAHDIPGLSHPDEADKSPKPDRKRELLDVEAIAENARQTGHAIIPVGNRTLDVEVQAVEYRSADWTGVLKDAKGKTKSVGFWEVSTLGTFRARLSGEQDWNSSLTMTAGFLQGIIILDECDLAILSTAEEAPAAPSAGLAWVEYWISTERSPGGAHEDPGPTSCENSFLPSGIGPLPLTEFNRPTSTRYLNIALDSDTEFYNAGQSQIWSRQAAPVNDMQNAIWDDQLNLRFSIVHQETWTSGGPTSTDGCTLLGQVKADWVANNGAISRHNVLFLSQRNFDGSVVGCAYQPGVHSINTWSYAVVQTKYRDSLEEYRASAHEVGHNYNGDHGYANTVYTGTPTSCFDVEVACRRFTIMATGVNDYEKMDRFSQGTVNTPDDEKNAWRIRWCADNMANCATLKKSG